MPMCTYLSDTIFTQPTSDKEINTLLSEVRRITGKDWRVAEEIVKCWWYTTKRYTLYNHTQGPEFQIVNFYRADSGQNINTSVEAGYIAAYFYGLLSQLGE
jgi:hypothetical protein